MSEIFDQIKREPLLPESHYTEVIEDSKAWFNDPEIDEILADPEKDEDHKQGILWKQTGTAFRILLVRYSAGEDISGLKPYAIQALSMFDAYYKRFPGSKLKLWEPDAYQYVMWLLGIAVLFDLKEHVPTIATWISKSPDDGQDILVRKLFDRLGIHFPGESLIHDKPYAALLKATESIGGEQQADMKQYLKQWYRGMKNCYWYNAHKNLQGFFFGYWSFEAALVTLAWNIDDTEYRDMPFYPADLIDFAKQRREVGDKERQLAHISAVSGEQCPHAGLWAVLESPGTFVQERVFTLGERFPDAIGRDGQNGAVTWIVLRRYDGGPTRKEPESPA